MGFLSTIRAILLMAVLIIGGPVVIGMGYKEAKDSKALADHGVVTNAAVTQVTWSTKRGNDRNFKAAIAFTTADGKDATGTVSLSNDQGKALRDQPEDKPSTLSVRYLPEDPSTVALADHKDESTFYYGAGVLMFLVGIGILVYRLRKKPQAELATA